MIVMGWSWFKWMLIVAALFVASGNAHAFAHHAGAKLAPCVSVHHHDAGHHHSHGQSTHDDCCCSCFNCPSGLMTPPDVASPRSVAYSVGLAPARASPLASRGLSPELAPPRPSALS